MKTIKTKKYAQLEDSSLENSSLDGKNNAQAKNVLNNILSQLPLKGFFSDETWEPVHFIFKTLREKNISYNITSADYSKDENGNPHRKEWKVEFPFINNKNRQTILYGNIIASGAGSVEKPLARYDITAYVS